MIYIFIQSGPNWVCMHVLVEDRDLEADMGSFALRVSP